MIDAKISDLKETKKELRRHLMRRQHELRHCRNVYSDLLAKTECLNEFVNQSLLFCAMMASENSSSEINALKNAIKKIDEQIKKQEVSK